ncbi:MAG TPA: STAS domain-containing protein [Zeimonas sp.]
MASSAAPAAQAPAGSTAWRFPSEVRFANAREIVEAASSALATPAPRYDLSGCQRFDSSLLAVLLELERRAAALARECRFESPAENLLKLAALYGIDALLFEKALESALAEVRAAPAPAP